MTETSTAPAIHDRLSELGVEFDPAIPYRLEKIFPKLEGWGVKKAIRRKGKLIGSIEPELKEMLQPGEEVLYVAKGLQYSLAEQYFLGIWSHTINHTVFVLTNLRVLMMRTNTKGVPKHTFWMIFYSQMVKFKGTWHGSFVVKLKDKKTLKFSGFPTEDRKQMRMVFEDAVEHYRELGFDPEVTQSVENLCTYCKQTVPKDVHDCGQCGATFWKPSTVAIRSFVFPAWGDILLKHYVLACAELCGYAVTWFIIVGAIFSGLERGDPAFGLIVAAILLPFTHTVDALLTYAIAKKGLTPKTAPAAA